MDRPVAAQIQRQRTVKTLVWIMLALSVLIAGFWIFRNSLQTSLKKSRLQTAVAEVGSIESTLTASGELIPAFELVLTSPIPAAVENVLVSVGSEVQPNQTILTLDKSATLLEYEKLQDELELKRNSIAKLKLTLQKNLYDLEINDSIKLMEISSLKADQENMKRLIAIGGGVQESLDKVNLDLRIAQLEKKQLEHDLNIQRQSTETDLKEQEIGVRIQQHKLAELERKLQLADIHATRSGVLTWVQDRIGATVQEGEQLARIADLQSYKILATCSDVYADRLKIGMKTLIHVNETRLEGYIANIRPTVENNIMTFEVQLEQNNHPALRPNMKVEVFIVTASQTETVKVANGPAFNGQAKQYVFVLKGDVAERREVETGLSNFDYIEITRNIQPGEEIIISDMSAYEHKRMIKIRPD